jgi:hypothetical protein
MFQILKGHVSPETAYVVNDYPYGFKLRCKIRYWLEYNPKHGFRLVSQTTNPKSVHEVWNKPKANTYTSIAVMHLDDKGHVTWSSFPQHRSAADCIQWRDTYGEGLPEKMIPALNAYIAARQEREEKHRLAMEAA